MRCQCHGQLLENKRVILEDKEMRVREMDFDSDRDAKGE